MPFWHICMQHVCTLCGSCHCTLCVFCVLSHRRPMYVAMYVCMTSCARQKCDIQMFRVFCHLCFAILLCNSFGRFRSATSLSHSLGVHALRHASCTTCCATSRRMYTCTLCTCTLCAVMRHVMSCHVMSLRYMLHDVMSDVYMHVGQHVYALGMQMEHMCDTPLSCHYKTCM